jgi:transcriptional regulator with XRE-family HTH domain
MIQYLKAQLANLRRIKVLIAAKELSVVQIASKVGVSKSYVSNTIHGRRCSRRLQEQIAKILGASFEELFTSDENETRAAEGIGQKI